MKKGLAILDNPDNVIPAINNFFTEDTAGALNDLWAEFSFNEDSTIEDAQERLATILKNAD